MLIQDIFVRIPVKSLVTRKHRNETVIRKNGPAVVTKMPHGQMYLHPTDRNLVCETNAVEGVHYELLDKC